VKRVAWLHEGWELARSAPGTVPDPSALARVRLEWHPAQVPGTVASALRHDPDLPGPFDRDDWWYRVRFAAPERREGVRHRLRFEGLATLAEVWLNGEPLLSSRNMFAPCAADVTDRLHAKNDLAIRFASLESAPPPKRPRARWKSALVSRPGLRALRTTLLGRMPGWTPAVDPVGPWGAVALESIERLDLESLELHATVQGEMPHLRVEARIAPLEGARIEEARVRIEGRAHALAIEEGEIARVHGEIEVPEAPLWWPHTHGAPSLASCRLEVRSGDEWIAFDADRIGFRRIELDEREGGVRFAVNGVPVFCRGACWTPLDILRLRAEPEALRGALVQLRDAGANMLRIPGNTAYESDHFYALCDELGILVWQDFMFANLDYPVADAQFRADVEEEARALLERLHAHPCIAAYCGGSEVAQQAAMLGLPAEAWSNELFSERLPALLRELHPGIPYFPSTPWGGPLPFHPGEGIAHYYGVGAYRRPLSDARLAQVKFAAECLAFSQVPEEESLERAFGTATPAPHHPRWKARQPRDNGAGWDFEDVRDHYLRELFRVDPVALRSRDVARYLALSRAVPGELMRRVFAEWRSSSSTCGGALVWLHRDLVPGAGWGIVDAYGEPKSAYWFLKRAWAPRAVHVTDEGLNGLAIHVVNESAEPLAATVELDLVRADGVVLDSARHGVLVPARATFTFNSEAMLGHFADSTAAYRFGPARHAVAIARLADVEGRTLAEDFPFPEGLDLPMLGAAPVRTELRWLEGGRVAASVTADAFLQDVRVACEGFAPDDNHFHLAPGREKRLVFRPLGAHAARFEARLEALNLASPLRLRAGRDAKDRAA
jgi:beta-mannosidase